MDKRYQMIFQYRCPRCDQRECLSLEEFAARCGVHQEFICRLLELGILDYSGPMESPCFTAEEAAKVQKIIRLRKDLGLNLLGVGLVLDLLDEIEMLRRQIEKLRRW
ncbi:MAG: chaperone modulator CbpM [Peptococcaceae bacterium]